MNFGSVIVLCNGATGDLDYQNPTSWLHFLVGVDEACKLLLCVNHTHVY